MIKFKLEENVTLPKYQSEGAVGMDVIANSIIKVFKGDVEITGEKLKKIKEGFKERGYIKLRPFERMLFGTGVTLAKMDNDLEIQVRSRSGKALKQGLIVINQPGTIDPDYRGEIGVIIYNSSPFLNKIELSERIAQLVVNEIVKPKIEVVSEVSKTKRGFDGFGSTGTSENV